MLQIFTLGDVEELKQSPTESSKLRIVDKLTRTYDLKELTADEVEIANAIMRLLIRDVSVTIRREISEKFCKNVRIPHDVAVKIANDLEDIVANPFISNSPVLTDEDLVELLKNSSESRQALVASRENLSNELAKFIIDGASPDAVASLMENKSANIEKEDWDDIHTRFQHDHEIVKEMVVMKRLSFEKIYGMINEASDDLRKLIIDKYEVPASIVNGLVEKSEESITSDLVRMQAFGKLGSITVQDIVDRLENQKKLNLGVILKGLSIGSTKLFYASLAKLSGIPQKNIEKVLENGGISGFQTLFQKCSLPESLMECTYFLHNAVIEEIAKGTPKTQIEHKVKDRLDQACEMDEVSNVRHLITIVTFQEIS